MRIAPFVAAFLATLGAIPLPGAPFARSGIVAPAAAYTLAGEIAPGGLLVGRARPGSVATFDGAPVRVSPEGVFVVALPPDAAGDKTLIVGEPGASPETRVLAIAPRHWDVQRIDGLPPRMVSPTPDDLVRIRRDAERIAAVKSLHTDTAFFLGGFVMPVDGPVTGVYGARRILNGEERQPHWGLDIAAPEGTPVGAAAAGIVALAEPDMYYTGGTVVLDHGLGVTTVYSHLKDVLVKEGEAVDRGHVLGRVGATGRATGAHLDWRANHFTTRLDPALLPRPAAVAGTP